MRLNSTKFDQIRPKKNKIRPLTAPCFVIQSNPMGSNWAAEHLQVIRTLMERSAIYRRALAPIMIFNGIVGVAGGILGALLKIDSTKGFIGFWAGAGLLALGGSFLLV